MRQLASLKFLKYGVQGGQHVVSVIICPGSRGRFDTRGPKDPGLQLFVCLERSLKTVLQTEVLLLSHRNWRIGILIVEGGRPESPTIDLQAEHI